MLSRTSRQRGEQNGGDAGRSQMTKASSPGRGSRSEWCTIRREPPGPPARLWQTFRKEDSAAAGPYARSILGLDPRTVAALPERRMQRDKNAERGAGRSHINYLDRLLLAPRPRQAGTYPEGEIPTGGDAWGF